MYIQSLHEQYSHRTWFEDKSISCSASIEVIFRMEPLTDV